MSKVLMVLDSMQPYEDAAEAIRQADRRGVLTKVPRLRQVVAWHVGRRKTHPLEHASTWARGADLNLVSDACEIVAEDLGAPLTARRCFYLAVLCKAPKPEIRRRLNRDAAHETATMFSFLASYVAGPAPARESFARHFRQLAEGFQKIADVAGTEGRPPADLITTAVAVEDYHVSDSTIRRWVREGRLQDFRAPGKKNTRAILVSRSAVAALQPRKKSTSAASIL
ncbi:MAG TPA: hypothetical protein VMY69_04570 [Phycisphaerae bacterium]|nr:hypothetical protein [Phycisphaerae bacterium]